MHIVLSWLKSTCYCPGDSWLPCSLSCQSQLRALDPWPLEFYLPLLTTGLSYSQKQPWTATSHLTFLLWCQCCQVFQWNSEFPWASSRGSSGLSLVTRLLSSRNTISQKYGSLSHAQMKRHLMCSLASTQKFHPNLTSLFVLWENLPSYHLGCFVKVVTIPGFAHLESEFFF